MNDYNAALLPGYYYHVFNGAVGKEKLFPWLRNYAYFLLLFERYIFPMADLFCYCLLPRHFHLFIRIRDEATIGGLMQKLGYQCHGPDAMERFILQRFDNFFNAYAKALNKQQGRKGRLFLEPFSRRMVHAPEYFPRLVQYIHHNPVKHGVCGSAADWQYSSYHQLKIGNGKVRDEVLQWFGSVRAFEEAHRQPVVGKI